MDQWAGQRSRYSDWLRAGRSGDRIPGGRDFLHLSVPSVGPIQPPVQQVLGLSRAKERPERDADPSPPSSAVVMKGQSYTSTPPMGRTACTEPQCLYKGALYLYIENGRSQWPRGLSRRCAAACLLRLWVRIPPGAWMFVMNALCCKVEVSATS